MSLIQILAMKTQFEIESDLRDLEYHFTTWELEFKLKHSKLRVEESEDEDRGSEDTRIYYEMSRAMIDNIHKPIYVKSTLVMLFSVLDISLHKIGEFLSEVNQVDDRTKTGFGLDRSYKYLKKNFDIALDELDQDSWVFLKSTNAVRNCIVHAGSDTTYLGARDKAAVEKLADGNYGLSVSKFGRITISYELVEEIFHAIKNLLETLIVQKIEPHRNTA
ncbi:hypothetical protein V9K20_003724 [Vibrio cholerae]|uniref:hypothetical protein n=1 Tax=Vibrio cholerae TaxID=666 RepID=UPI001C304E0D|nr:hypothetical protein [Vibrio cholerae]ELH5152437.1 hypothetical protein [Vibrio cholerae]